MAVALSSPQPAASRPTGTLTAPFPPPLCAHCQSPVLESPIPHPETEDAAAHPPVFCCNGCRFVFELIHAQGLQRFYQIRDAPLPPVSSRVFQRRNFDWLPPLLLASKGSVRLEIQGLSCLACVWLIEKQFLAQPGALSIRVDPLAATAHLTVIPEVFDSVHFASALQNLGYLLGPVSASTPASPNRSLVLRLGVCAALAMNAMLFSVPFYGGLSESDPYAPLFAKISFLCGSLSLLTGATLFIQRAWGALRMGVLHVDLPISLGLLAAYAGSLYAWLHHQRSAIYFDFVSMFTFLMLLGRWIRQTAIDQNRKRLLQTPLAVLQPDAQQTYSLPQGHAVPVRSLLLEGSANLAMEWINGEPDAKVVHAGCLLPSGALNLGPGPLPLRAEESWKDSLLCQLLHLPQASPDRDPRSERFILVYLVSVISLALIGFLAWKLHGAPLDSALQVLLSVLVVSCPCASGVALPLATELATAHLRHHGVFVRNASLWSRLRALRRIAFDKTGTLTTDTPPLANPEALRSLSPDTRSILAHLLSRSLHPTATSLREHLPPPTHPASPPLPQPRETPGQGIALEDPSTGELWRIGRPDWALLGHPVPPDSTHSTVFSRNGELLAAFRFEESLREDAPREIDALQRQGLRIQILSGDPSDRVPQIATRLALPADAALSGLSPLQKAQWLTAHHAQTDTLMVGDGANDSLAFEASLCCGTPAVDRGLLEHKADFFYLGRGLSGVRLLLETARAKEHVTRAVLVFTTLYNVSAVALSLAGKMHPLLAAILMPLSSLVSIGLVLLLQRPRRPLPPS
ncbi:MAG: putative copper-importing P-type ATPase [Verrucomicrobiota bacterium]